MYCIDDDIPLIQAVKDFDNKEIEKKARQFYDDKGKPVDADIWNKNFKDLASGIEKGYSTVYNAQDVRMNYELKNNAGVFAAFKAYRMGKDVSRILVDEKGNKRQWSAFLKKYKELNGQYNHHWLDAEYNMAQRKASSAKQWQDFQRDKDVYPNLQYMPSKSANPRDAHKRYYGVIKPIDDPFWDDVLPPSGWNCKCWVQQTRDEADTNEFEIIPPPKGIAGNPGKTGRVFAPDHPYVQSTNKNDKQQVKEAFNSLRPAMDDKPIIYHGNKGKVEVSLNSDPKDYLNNFKYSKVVTDKYKGTMKVLEDSDEVGVKNPELRWNGKTGDRVQWDGDKIKTFINNRFQKKMKQLKNYDKKMIAFDFKNKLNKKNYEDAVDQLKPKINKVEFVIWKNDDKVIIINNEGFDKIKVLNKIKKELLK